MQGAINLGSRPARCGALHCSHVSLHHHEPGARLLLDLTHGGVEYAFEMAGRVEALELAYKITRRGGTTVTASLPHPDARFALPHTNLVAEERTLKGSYVGSCVPARDIPRFIQLYQQGLLPVDRLMSETVKLADINAGFDRLADGGTVRQRLVV